MSRQRRRSGTPGARAPVEGRRGGRARGVRAAGPYADRPALILHGGVGGLMGGISMALVAMIVAPVMGRAFTSFPRLVAAVVYGEGATAGWAPVVVGLLIHLAMAVALGVLFALAVGLRPNVALWAMLFAVGAWAISQFVILPGVNPLLAEGIPAPLYFVYHLVYGGALGAYLSEARR